MYNWSADAYGERRFSFVNLIIFASAASSAVLLFLVFAPQIRELTTQMPYLIEMMYFPTIFVGFLFGLKITERAINPAETRSPIKRGIIKVLLFFFIIGGLFSSVSFALHGGIHLPEKSLLDMGLAEWVKDFSSHNSGLTFLIVTSISLMAVATKRIIGLQGIVNSISAFFGTFIFFSMVSLSLSHTQPSASQVYLYTFYHAGIIGGALYKMNKLTSNLNMWEDFSNGYR
ncbi:MAG: hypothetical protein EB170_03140 [Nitrosopumilaceae archaeon]|nr:hypothetical protein [Nitrososphaeria archaeon]NDB51993.1 hypothetical protein [Nitrosopumilaceae archaeon]NDB88246.1 hypothetical protein [Nitrososphaerota archaeon]NDB62856.1 hypothetical protein [Nitrosopumilaceae archaeon]NDB89957.1 hypothetical protein [Nitrososphaerota archaeon]